MKEDYSGTQRFHRVCYISRALVLLPPDLQVDLCHNASMINNTKCEVKTKIKTLAVSMSNRLLAACNFSRMKQREREDILLSAEGVAKLCNFETSYTEIMITQLVTGMKTQIS